MCQMIKLSMKSPNSIVKLPKVDYPMQQDYTTIEHTKPCSCLLRDIRSLFEHKNDMRKMHDHISTY